MNSEKNDTGDCHFEQNRFTISIIGLGLIGGSMAMALKNFRSAYLIGVDTNPETRKQALATGTVDEVYETADDAITNADMVILCVYPHHIIDFAKNQMQTLKDGCIVTDVCGAKMKLYEALIPFLPRHIEYVGIHPMAGKEIDGFENAEKALFANTGFLITPLESTKAETTALMQELGKYIGATKIAVANPELHDDIIGYTSDLMHISATSLCMHRHPDMTSAYTAGAFRDCTRVSNINPDLWTELLLTNAHGILPHLNRYIDDLQKMKQAIETGDANALHELLALASKNKKEMLTR